MTDREKIRLLLELFIDQYNENSIEVAKKDALINTKIIPKIESAIEYLARTKNLHVGECIVLEFGIEQIAATFNIKIENKLVKSNFDYILSNKAYNFPIEYDEYSIIED